jgi:hypothetical protein
LVALVLALALSGCGSTKVVYVFYPPHPVTGLCGAERSRGRAVRCLDARVLIGLKPSRAEGVARRYGDEVRIVERNGKGLALTGDYQSNRIDVIVNDGLITRLHNWG